MPSKAELVASLKRMQIALGEFCCDNCISHDDMEDSHSELLNASNEADELLKAIDNPPERNTGSPQLAAAMYGIAYEDVMGGPTVDLCDDDTNIDEMLESKTDSELVCVVSASDMTLAQCKAFPMILKALKGLLETTELNLDEIEPETKEAIALAQAALDAANDE